MFHIFNFILVLNKFHKTSMSHLKSTTLSNGKSMSQNYLITKKNRILRRHQVVM